MSDFEAKHENILADFIIMGATMETETFKPEKNLDFFKDNSGPHR